MKRAFKTFCKNTNLEIMGLCAAVALLVLCALFISPGGPAELDRVQAAIQQGQSQGAWSVVGICITNCAAYPIVWRFNATPSTVSQYERTTLSWTASADYCFLTGPNVHSPVWPQASYVTHPLEVGTTVFYLKCYDTGGHSSGETPWVAVSVNVTPAGSGSLSLIAAPASITTGAQSILSWNAAGDTTRINACVLSGGRFGGGTETGSLTGALETGPLSQTTVFAFTCNDTYFGWLSPVEAVVYVSAPPPPPPVPCTSAPNACGLRSTGQIINGVCNATPPPNSQCPPPKIPAANFTAEPTIVHKQQAAQISWNVTDATTCTLESDSSSFASREVGTSGSVSSGAIERTTTFTITCQNGDGGPKASRSIKVAYDPTFIEI